MHSHLYPDTTLTKIFVGGLPYHTTDESLREFFSKFGPIEEAVVINDRSTGKSRGYGFVTMRDKEAADEATRDPNPTIDGRRTNINLAYFGAKNRTTTVPLNYGLIPTYPTPTTMYPSNVLYYPIVQAPSLYLATSNRTAYELPVSVFEPIASKPAGASQPLYWPQ